MALFGPAALADSVIGSAAWQSFPGTLHEDNSIYWDNQSMDGSQLNVGYYLNGTGGSFPASSPGITPDWWGNSNGSADQSYYFGSSGSQANSALQVEVAGYSNINQFGWYDVSTPTLLNSLFDGPDGAGSAATFTPTGDYGFYLQTAGGALYYTQSSLNPSGEMSHQHFALFQDPANSSSYYIGVEDLGLKQTGIEKSGDYNDMVIHVGTMQGVPEPSSFLLMGGGLLGVAFFMRKKSLQTRTSPAQPSGFLERANSNNGSAK